LLTTPYLKHMGGRSHCGREVEHLQKNNIYINTEKNKNKNKNEIENIKAQPEQIHGDSIVFYFSSYVDMFISSFDEELQTISSTNNMFNKHNETKF
jgi:hypothetical protein